MEKRVETEVLFSTYATVYVCKCPRNLCRTKCRRESKCSLLYQHYKMYSILQGTCCRTLFIEPVQDKVEKRVKSQVLSSLCIQLSKEPAQGQVQKRQNTGSLLSSKLALHSVQDSTRNLSRIKWRRESKQVIFSISTTQCIGLAKEPSQGQVETRVKTSSLFH